MRNFFEHQDRARRNTRLLVALMALGVLAMGSAIYVVLVLFTNMTGGSAALLASRPLLHGDLLLASLLGTGAVVTAASGARVASLRGGGAQIAEMLGGRLASGSPRDPLEKRLLNVVEEMAIASGVPVPQVFVLDGEEGINAFAAGFTTADAAIAVTRGSLEKLTRDELQGVIAHEFSHVLNGDIRLNVRLMGIVFGIVCIALLGRLMMRVGSHSSGSLLTRKRGSPGAAILVLGLAVFAIGSIGELIGKVIKAAVSRERELLADASAVQFTRNPHGIAGALKKIGGLPAHARVASARAEEASHFFFGDIHRRVFAASLLATHPPLALRIRRIDPSFAGQFPAVGAGIAEPVDDAVSALAAGGRPAHGATAASVVARVGAPTREALACGKQLLAGLPQALREAAHSPFSACAIVYALLLSDDPVVDARQRAQIEASCGAALRDETLRLHALVRSVGRAARLPLCELLAPALRELSRDQRAVFARTVQALIDADRAVSVFEYVLAETLRSRLLDAAAPARRSGAQHKSLEAVRSELALLLSLLAHAGDADGQSAATAFAAGASRLRGVALSLLPQSDRLLTALGPALAQLRALPPQLRAPLVDACGHVALADLYVGEDEATLLRAVCDALDCPLPPLVTA
jgi:Zn-dependent protease with chaperone function